LRLAREVDQQGVAVVEVAQGAVRKTANYGGPTPIRQNK
jgi:hypothetical protein